MVRGVNYYGPSIPSRIGIPATDKPKSKSSIDEIIDKMSRVNGPCFVYDPINAWPDSVENGSPTHILNMQKTIRDSRGWDEREIELYMQLFNVRTELTLSQYTTKNID